MAPVENKDSVSLTCQSDSEDVTDLVWFINQSSPAGDRIVLSPDNRTLTIINVTREDQGPYECEIWNPVSRNRSEPFTLNITYPNYPLSISNVSLNDTGTYTCNASNSATGLSSSKDINVTISAE
ncbi:cell adhesion molecule CEACAM1-like [Notamacropus eugenii]|uniref:cell adhesion molecule CEACAM1-like n=1 Tax=Notamacropus eugenii TaxID=9315 RepID=UPI003B66C48D